MWRKFPQPSLLLADTKTPACAQSLHSYEHKSWTHWNTLFSSNPLVLPWALHCQHFLLISEELNTVLYKMQILTIQSLPNEWNFKNSSPVSPFASAKSQAVFRFLSIYFVHSSPLIYAMTLPQNQTTTGVDPASMGVIWEEAQEHRGPCHKVWQDQCHSLQRCFNKLCLLFRKLCWNVSLWSCFAWVCFPWEVLPRLRHSF